MLAVLHLKPTMSEDNCMLLKKQHRNCNMPVTKIMYAPRFDAWLMLGEPSQTKKTELKEGLLFEGL